MVCACEIVNYSSLFFFLPIFVFALSYAPYITAPSNAPASSVASRRSLEPLKIYSEAQVAAGKRRRNSGEFVGTHFFIIILKVNSSTIYQ